VVPFLFKRDVIPGHLNDFEVTVTKAGVFQGRCAEYCGIHHDRMLFTVRAINKADFPAWLARTQQEAQKGSNAEISTYTGRTYPAPSHGSNL
jgi:cytochrome c oxidase subunit 2